MDEHDNSSASQTAVNEVTERLSAAIAVVSDAEAHSQRLNDEARSRIAEMTAEIEARKRPEHNRNIDLKTGAYDLDEHALVEVDRLLSIAVGTPLRWLFELEGSRTVSANNLGELLQEPVVKTRTIKKIHGLASGPPPNLSQVSLRVSGEDGITFDASSRDTKTLAVIEETFRELTVSNKAQLSIVYNPWLSIIVTAVLSLGTAALVYYSSNSSNSQTAALISPIIVWLSFLAWIFGLSYARKLLLPRVQFSIGKSSRDLHFRRRLASILGPIFLSVLVLSLFQEAWIKVFFPS